MTVEHDGQGGYDRDDPLMAVLTGDPLPADARTDPTLLAEYRSAEADVALLREQLGIIAHALTEPAPTRDQASTPGPKPVPRPEPGTAPASGREVGAAPLPGSGAESEREVGAAPASESEAGAAPASESRPGPRAGGSPASRPGGPGAAARPALSGTVPSREPGRRSSRVVRNGLGLARNGLGLAAAVAVFMGMGWLVVQAGAGAGDGAASGAKADRGGAESAQKSLGPLGSPAYLACTRLLVEGTVTDVVPGPRSGEERVTLDVTRSYRPTDGSGDKATFVKDDVPAFGAPRSLREGDRVLVAVPRRGDAADVWFVGEEDIAPQRRAIAEALPRARATTCP